MKISDVKKLKLPELKRIFRNEKKLLSKYSNYSKMKKSDLMNKLMSEHKQGLINLRAILDTELSKIPEKKDKKAKSKPTPNKSAPKKEAPKKEAPKKELTEKEKKDSKTIKKFIRQGQNKIMKTFMNKYEDYFNVASDRLKNKIKKYLSKGEKIEKKPPTDKVKNEAFNYLEKAKEMSEKFAENVKKFEAKNKN
tara:strand:+ start:1196 stop:1777 length:582 start_codon:yes stop_codon:yes gene_type:complete